MEDIVMETVMFQHPPEWGRRVIKRGDEILLQGTSDKGKTWSDMPIPEFKLTMPETMLRTASANPYAGLGAKSRLQLRSSSESEPLKLDQKLQAIVDSGSLLSIEKNISTSPEGKDLELETITFLGAYKITGLPLGAIWVDSENYLRVVT